MRATFLAVLATIAIAAPSAAAPALPTGVTRGFQSPESMVWDEVSGAWYVSNWGGGIPFFGAMPGDGYIAKLVPGGMPEVWATGLDDPQGVIIDGRTMYVANGGEIRVIDMDDPTQQESIAVEGASFADLDVDPATGDLYVADLGGNRVWRITDGAGEVWAGINAPDGAYLHDGGLFIANFALGGPGGIFRIDLSTKEITTVADIPGATLDGLERDGDGWLTTDFTKGLLLRVGDDGSVAPLGELGPGAADIGFDPATRTVAVPNLLLGLAAFVTV